MTTLTLPVFIFSSTFLISFGICDQSLHPQHDTKTFKMKQTRSRSNRAKRKMLPTAGDNTSSREVRTVTRSRRSQRPERAVDPPHQSLSVPSQFLQEAKTQLPRSNRTPPRAPGQAANVRRSHDPTRNLVSQINKIAGPSTHRHVSSSIQVGGSESNARNMSSWKKDLNRLQVENCRLSKMVDTLYEQIEKLKEEVVEKDVLINGIRQEKNTESRWSKLNRNLDDLSGSVYQQAVPFL